MKFGGRARRREVGMDLTPMIDVVFQLVLFFVLTTNFVDERDAEVTTLQVDLPPAEAGQVSAGDGAVHVRVASDGSVSMEDGPVSAEELRRRFADVAAADAQRLVVLRADRAAAHADVVEVMDAARAAGLLRLAIATTPTGPTSPVPP